MLQNTKDLYGHKLSAVDGEIGQVKDFYFDDTLWAVRYLVADTGSWLTGRLVLLAPHSFGRWDQFERTLHVKLPIKQIEASPSIESHRPVSRQNEIDFHKYYGWPAYWNGGAIWGLGGLPVILPPSKDEMEADLNPHQDDKHLQSTQALTGFHVQSGNETIGHVSGFLVDDRSWEIHNLVVETGHWYSGQEVLIAPEMVERISIAESKIFVTTTIAEIQSAAENEFPKADSKNPMGEDSVSAALSRKTRVIDTARTFFSLPIPSTAFAPA